MPRSRSKKQTRIARAKMRSNARAERIYQAADMAQILWLVHFRLRINFLP